MRAGYHLRAAYSKHGHNVRRPNEENEIDEVSVKDILFSTAVLLSVMKRWHDSGPDDDISHNHDKWHNPIMRCSVNGIAKIIERQRL